MQLVKNSNIELDVYSSTKVYGSDFKKENDDTYKDLYEQAKVLPNVNLLDYKPNMIYILDNLHKYDAFVYPNIWEETFCISALEALACGLYVVTTDNGALYETCSEFPVYIPMDTNLNNLAIQFGSVIDDLPNQMNNKGFQYHLKFQQKFYNHFYNWKNIAGQWTSFLKGAINARPNCKPIWFDKEKEPQTKDKPKSKFSIFVATPVHSDVSIHYFQACLEFQKFCMKRDVLASFQVMKSSLVTQGRNLCVSSFMESKHTHLLFVDSDIDFQAQSIFKMVAADKDIISVPYPLKQLMWDKAWERISKGNINNPKDLKYKGLYTYPMKVQDEKDIRVKDGVIEVTHSPTGCMLIKREVIEKMIKLILILRLYKRQL